MFKLHISKFGQTGNAPILALLHGWGSSSKIWQPCLEKLTEDFRVWCVDLPGHGESQGVAWDESLAQGLELLAAILPERCYLAGWSLGGLFAQLYVKQYPQRVQSLMLIASPPKFIAAPDWPHAMPNETFAKFSQQFNTSPERTLKQFRALQALHSVMSKEIMYILEQAASNQHPERMAWGLQWLQELDLRDSCVTEDIFLQLLHGENDRIAPVKAAEQTMKIWQSSHKNLQLCIIADAGHAPFLSHPEQFHEQAKLMLANTC